MSRDDKSNHRPGENMKTHLIKRLVAKLYKELLKLNYKKKKIKWAKDKIKMFSIDEWINCGPFRQ